MPYIDRFPQNYDSNLSRASDRVSPSLSTLLKIVTISIGIFLILGIVALLTPLIALAAILIVAVTTGTLVSQSTKIVETTSAAFNITPQQDTRVKYRVPQYNIEVIKPIPDQTRSRSSSSPPPFNRKEGRIAGNNSIKVH